MEVFGARPRSFRAGRWGLGTVGLRLLAEAGYTVDTSVVPLTSFRGCTGSTPSVQGPSFLRAPQAPYYPKDTDLLIIGDGSLFEVPVTAGTIGLLSSPLAWVLRSGKAGGDLFRRGLQKMRLGRLVRLQPAEYALQPMLALADTFLQRRASVVNIALHSSEWVARQSPFVPDEPSARRMHEAMRTLLEYLRPHTESCTLAELAPTLGDGQILGAHIPDAAASCKT